MIECPYRLLGSNFRISLNNTTLLLFVRETLKVHFQHFKGVSSELQALSSTDTSTLAVGILLVRDKMGGPSTMSTTRPSKLSTVVVSNQIACYAQWD